MKKGRIQGIQVYDVNTIPNIITLSRMLLIPPIIWGILNGYMIFTAILVIISYTTDIADGYIARKLDLHSEFGRIIDPLTDKVTLIVILVCLSYINRFPAWAAVLIIGREAVILGTGLYLVIKRIRVVPSLIYGKITGYIFLAMEIYYILNITLLLNVILYMALVSMTIAFIMYLKQFRLSLKNQRLLH